jgi:hypothetical protein
MEAYQPSRPIVACGFFNGSIPSPRRRTGTLEGDRKLADLRAQA